MELLQKLLNNELKIRQKKYLVQSRSFPEMLEATIRRYQNRTIEAAQVIAELIDLAKQMREGHKRGDKLGLTDDEVAFYDALETNDSAVKVLGEPTLKNIARELVSHVRKSVTIDWTLRSGTGANPRARPPHPPQIRLSARQAGEGDSDGIGAGETALRRLGRSNLNSNPALSVRLKISANRSTPKIITSSVPRHRSNFQPD